MTSRQKPVHKERDRCRTGDKGLEIAELVGHRISNDDLGVHLGVLHLVPHHHEVLDHLVELPHL